MGLPEKLLEELRSPGHESSKDLDQAVNSVERFAQSQCLESLDRMLAFSENFTGSEAIHSDAALSESSRITEMTSVLNKEVARFLSLHPMQKN